MKRVLLFFFFFFFFFFFEVVCATYEKANDMEIEGNYNKNMSIFNC